MKLCILLFLHFQNIVAYRIYQLESGESIEVLPRIRQILLNQRHAIPGYDIYAKREQSLLKPVGEPVFVKRIVPHGYITGEYEYDSKLNTIFKPLARYHVKKPIEEHEKSILKDLESEQNQPEHTGKNLIILVQKNQEKQDLLRQIQKLLIHNTKQMNREKKAKARIRKLIKELGKNSLLMLREKSGEEHDPFLPPHIANQLQQPKSKEEEDPKVIYPSYPFWNYWTVS